MAAYVLLAPAAPFEKRPREHYLERVTDDGRPTLTPIAITARRFASAGAARAWASRFGELLDDFVVVRR